VLGVGEHLPPVEVEGEGLARVDPVEEEPLGLRRLALLEQRHDLGVDSGPVDPEAVAVDPLEHPAAVGLVAHAARARLAHLLVDAWRLALERLLGDGLLGRVPGVRRLHEPAAHAGEVPALRLGELAAAVLPRP
jgi:hypothetical protein